MAELIGLSYSPFTEKAKWTLDHHKAPYRYSEHLILFGEPMLRFKMGPTGQDLTVPAYIDGKTRLIDSFQIAQYIDQKGGRSKLIPAQYFEHIKHFNTQSQNALDAGRGLLLTRMSKSKKAKIENLPPFLPRSMGSLFVPLVSFGINYVSKSFKSAEKSGEEHAKTSRQILTELRTSLNGRPHLLDGFSFADIAMAVTLQFVSPVDNRFIKLGPATRECWTNPELKSEFADLIEWRDTLYQKYRA